MEFQPHAKVRKLRRKHHDSETQTDAAPQRGQAGQVLQLQRTIGNKATQQVLQRDSSAATAEETPQRLLEQGAVLAEKRDFDNALGLFEQALADKKITPLEKFKITYNMAVCYLRQNEVRTALEYFGRVMAMGEIDAKIYKLALQGHQIARNHVNKDYKPEDIFQEGVEDVENHDFADGAEKFSMLLNMFDNISPQLRAKAMYNLGACYHHQGKYRMALKQFEDTLALSNLDETLRKYVKRGLRHVKQHLGLLKPKGHKKPIIF